MSFNSVQFIFGFLPAALLGYYILSFTFLRPLRLLFVVVATLAFYARGSAHYVPLLVFSVFANYVAARAIVTSSPEAARVWLWLGVIANVGALIWFKYSLFIADNLRELFGANLGIGHVALPLAISFYTFQQVAFLVDVSRRRVEVPAPLGYFSFILFFPQLLAGPISQSREIVPQMAAQPKWMATPANLLIGATLFGLGLFKKTVVADTLVLWVNPVFDAAAGGATPAAAAAWGAALAYTLQIYFDFSGYSDMAIGVARMFGIVLPLNFHSPLRASSIVDLWRRWHITLGRFVQTYVFQPIAVPLARLCANRGLGGGASLVLSTLVPTFVAMLIIGAWHGANWTFFLFGTMHGTYMVINEAWNHLTRKKRRRKQALPRWRIAIAHALTLFAFVLAAVPFRSVDVTASLRVFAGMVGQAGEGAWSEWPVLVPLGVWGLFPLLAIGYLAIYLLPNTAQIMALIAPVLEWDKWGKIDPARLDFQWRPVVAWAATGGAVALLGLVFLARGTTQFVYFAF